MNTTSEIRIYELLNLKFDKKESQELVSELKSMTNDDLLSRVDDKITSSKSEIISSLTWRLFLFFIAQVGFTVGLVQLIS